MHGLHSVFDIAQRTVIHSGAGGVCRWLTNEKQRKSDISLIDQ